MKVCFKMFCSKFLCLELSVRSELADSVICDLYEDLLAKKESEESTGPRRSVRFRPSQTFPGEKNRYKRRPDIVASLLILVGLLLSPEDLEIFASSISSDGTRGDGDDVFRRVGKMSENPGEEREESLVVITRQEEEQDDRESQQAAALKTQLSLHRLDDRLEGEFDVLEGAICDEGRPHRL